MTSSRAQTKLIQGETREASCHQPISQSRTMSNLYISSKKLVYSKKKNENSIILHDLFFFFFDPHQHVSTKRLFETRIFVLQDMTVRREFSRRIASEFYFSSSFYESEHVQKKVFSRERRWKMDSKQVLLAFCDARFLASKLASHPVRGGFVNYFSSSSSVFMDLLLILGAGSPVKLKSSSWRLLVQPLIRIGKLLC